MTRQFHLAALAVVAALAAPGPALAAPASYTDPLGDNGAAPDIGLVTVDLGADGYLHIRPTIANQPALGDGAAVGVSFDTDGSLATGSRGRDYLALFAFEDLALTLRASHQAGSDRRRHDLRVRGDGRGRRGAAGRLGSE